MEARGLIFLLVLILAGCIRYGFVTILFDKAFIASVI